MRLFLLFFGGIGVLLLIQGIRNFIKGDSGDADQKSGGVQWSGGVDGRISGQEMDVDISHVRRRNMEVMTANITTSPDTTVSPDTTARMVCMAVSRQT